MANQGIVHISFERGRPALCKTRLAMQSTTIDLAHTWPAVCKRCWNKLARKTQLKIEARSAERIAAHALPGSAES